jgi:lambda family phage portal protein
MSAVGNFLRAIGTAVSRPRFGADANTGVNSLSPAYDAAGFSRRTLGWNAGTSEVNALISGSGDRLRALSRDTMRKNSWARSAEDSIVSNCVGTGSRPVSKHPVASTKKKLQDRWNRFAETCDPSGNLDIYGMQMTACRETVQAGEMLGRLLRRRNGTLQIQLLESEMLPYNKNAVIPNGWIQTGIEFNPNLEKTAYWLWRQHPGSLASLPQPQELLRVSADQVLHTFKVLRANQLRGEPWLTQVLIKLHELGKYDDAEIVRKNCAAMIAFIIEENDPTDPMFGENQATAQRDDSGIALAPIQPGSTVKLRRGETIKTLNPADVGGMYGTFMKMQLQNVAIAIGSLYADMSGDYDGMNFTTIRAANNASQRKWRQYQKLTLDHQFNKPIWRAFVESEIMQGNFSAREYEKDPWAFLNVDWRPERWVSADPLKDVEADERDCRAGFDSRASKISARGRDIEEVDDEIADGNVSADALDLRFDSDGRNAPASPKVTQAEDNTALPEESVTPPGKKKGTVIQ